MQAGSAELGRDLSSAARWALENVVVPIAEGATEYQALRESLNGVAYGEAKRRLELLREELEARGAPVVRFGEKR